MLRYTLCTLVGLALFAGGLAVGFLTLRAMVEIGNCATHPAFQVTRPCPDNMLGLFALLFGGMFAAFLGQGFYSLRAGSDRFFAKGPDVGGFWWPAVFLAGAWLFGELAAGTGEIDPAEATVLFWTFALLAALFVLMGIVPLIVARKRLTRLLLGGEEEVWGSLITPRSDPSDMADVADALRRYGIRIDIVPDSHAAAAGADDDPVTGLERLSRLHEAGLLSDSEFAAAKAALLDRGGGRP